jgi:Na+/H+ antiporter NhaA
MNFAHITRKIKAYGTLFSILWASILLGGIHYKLPLIVLTITAPIGIAISYEIAQKKKKYSLPHLTYTTIGSVLVFFPFGWLFAIETDSEQVIKYFGLLFVLLAWTLWWEIVRKR